MTFLRPKTENNKKTVVVVVTVAVAVVVAENIDGLYAGMCAGRSTENSIGWPIDESICR